MTQIHRKDSCSRSRQVKRSQETVGGYIILSFQHRRFDRADRQQGL